MESNLFIELSEEQQEVVAGGVEAGTKDLSAFKAILANRDVATVAGPFGAGTFSSSNLAIIESLGLSEFGIKI